MFHRCQLQSGTAWSSPWASDVDRVEPDKSFANQHYYDREHDAQGSCGCRSWIECESEVVEELYWKRGHSDASQEQGHRNVVIAADKSEDSPSHNPASNDRQGDSPKCHVWSGTKVARSLLQTAVKPN